MPSRLTLLSERYTSVINDMVGKHPRRRDDGRKNKGILIRVTEAQKQVLTETAKKTGLGLSPWILSIALRAAQKMKSA